MLSNVIALLGHQRNLALNLILWSRTFVHLLCCVFENVKPRLHKILLTNFVANMLITSVWKRGLGLLNQKWEKTLNFELIRHVINPILTASGLNIVLKCTYTQRRINYRARTSNWYDAQARARSPDYNEFRPECYYFTCIILYWGLFVVPAPWQDGGHWRRRMRFRARA